MAVGGGSTSITGAAATIETKEWLGTALARVTGESATQIHTDAVYTALINAAQTMENRLQESLKLYQEHPDVQANLQQLQYDLQSWNLALTTMTNIQKNMADALQSIATNLK